MNNEPKNTEAVWYREVSYPEAKKIIAVNIKTMSRSFIAIGYYLKHIRDKKLYLEDGYTSIWEFAESQYGITTSTASRWMSMNDRFSKGGNSPLIAEEYKEFGKSQLQEMLYLTDEQLEQASPEMPAKEIRKIRKPDPVKKSFEECSSYKTSGCCSGCCYDGKDTCPYDLTGYKVADWRIENDKQTKAAHDRVRAEECETELSVLGQPKRVYPKDSLLSSAGCGKTDDCICCHLEGCKIRQKDCFCVEAPMGNPYPCEVLLDIDKVKNGLGDRWNTCQFLNLNLADVRAGDGQPVPCCKQCKDPCRYQCRRAVEEFIMRGQEKINAKREAATRASRDLPETDVASRTDVTVANAIDNLDLSTRTYNVLKSAGICTIDQLRSKSDEELARIRGFSRRSMDEVHEALKAQEPEIAPAQQTEVPEGQQEQSQKDAEILDKPTTRKDFIESRTPYGAAEYLAKAFEGFKNVTYNELRTISFWESWLNAMVDHAGRPWIE